jgi:NarL family two-component system response regulator LiaR
MTSDVKVLIVDDHRLVREGLRTYLELIEGIRIIGEAKNGIEAVDQVQKYEPDIVLMDLVMPDMDGIEATRKIQELHPNTKVIVLTSFTDDENVFPAIQAGASGYLLKDISPSDLSQAIRVVNEGEKQLHPEITKKLMDQFVNPDIEHEFDLDDLTPRETDVLRLIAQGMSNKEIANTLTISDKTVKTHVSSILNKLDLVDRTQAAIFALKKHLV